MKLGKMFSVKFLSHKDVTSSDLDQIIAVKTAAWPYGYDKQVEWIKNNLSGDDVHVILTDNHHAVAYLNLIDIQLEIDNNTIHGFGIGNVCALEKGKGHGKIIIEKTNAYLLQKNTIGLLFCKEALLKFYSRLDWKYVDSNKLHYEFDTKNIETMIYNNNIDFKDFHYKGLSF